MPELLFEKRGTTLLPAASGGVSASVFIMTNLRNKLSSCSGFAIQTVRGLGYKAVLNDEEKGSCR